MKRAFFDHPLAIVVAISIMALLEIQGYAQSGLSLVDEGRFADLFDRYRLQANDDIYAPANVDLSSSADLAIVVIPGIIGEFLPNIPFADVAEAMRGVSTPVVRKWRSLVADPRQPTMPAFDLGSTTLKDQGLAVKQQPLGRLMDIFALPIDDRVVHVIVLKPPLFSLETFGDTDVSAMRYVERLDRVFSALGWTPDRIALIGYSLGTTTGFSMLDLIRRKQYAWSNHVRAFVNVAGTVYGNRITDIALGLVPGVPSVYNEYLNTLSALGEKLQYVGQTEEMTPGRKRLQVLIRPDIVTRNNLTWTSTVAGFANISLHYHDLLGSAGGILGSADIAKLVKSGNYLLDILTDNKKFVVDYDRNIKRWKLFLIGGRTAISQMTTPSRVAWFKNHEPFPAGMIFHDISAQIPEDPALIKDYSYDPRMLDFQVVSSNLRLNKTLTGFQQMDGWVGSHEKGFDPERAEEINPAWEASRFPHSTLGTMMTDHWGIVFPWALPTRGPVQLIHPFPRNAFLKAIGKTLLLELDAL